MLIAPASCVVAIASISLVVSTARRRDSRPEPDPFRALDLQMRLSRLAAEVRRIDRDRTMLARARHLRVALEAYDALLSEACALAHGAALEVAPPGTATPDTVRLDRELLLSARGWSW